jgi:hypothetical protein
MNVNVFAGFDGLNDCPDLGSVFLERVADLAFMPRELVPERNILRDGVSDLLIRDEITPNTLGAGGNIDDRNRYIVGCMVNQEMNHRCLSLTSRLAVHYT